MEEKPAAANGVKNWVTFVRDVGAPVIAVVTVSWIIWQIFTVMIPEQRQDFMKTIQAQREAFVSEMDKFRVAVEENTAAITRLEAMIGKNK